MNYAFIQKKCFFIYFISIAVLSALGDQYTVVNKSASEVYVYFGPEKGIDNYPTQAVTSPKESKTIKTTFTAQVIKCRTERGSLIGRAVSFVYPNTACSGSITVTIEDSNTDLIVSANCN